MIVSLVATPQPRWVSAVSVLRVNPEEPIEKEFHGVN
jgi:hypothetical protein